MMPSTPNIAMEREKAPETMVRVQPNSTISGVKKTPKAKWVPWVTVMMIKEAATTT